MCPLLLLLLASASATISHSYHGPRERFAVECSPTTGPAVLDEVFCRLQGHKEGSFTEVRLDPILGQIDYRISDTGALVHSFGEGWVQQKGPFVPRVPLEAAAVKRVCLLESADPQGLTSCLAAMVPWLRSRTPKVPRQCEGIDVMVCEIDAPDLNDGSAGLQGPLEPNRPRVPLPSDDKSMERVQDAATCAVSEEPTNDPSPLSAYYKAHSIPSSSRTTIDESLSMNSPENCFGRYPSSDSMRGIPPCKSSTSETLSTNQNATRPKIFRPDDCVVPIENTKSPLIKATGPFVVVSHNPQENSYCVLCPGDGSRHTMKEGQLRLCTEAEREMLQLSQSHRSLKPLERGDTVSVVDAAMDLEQPHDTSQYGDDKCVPWWSRGRASYGDTLSALARLDTTHLAADARVFDIGDCVMPTGERRRQMRLLGPFVVSKRDLEAGVYQIEYPTDRSQHVMERVQVRRCTEPERHILTLFSRDPCRKLLARGDKVRIACEELAGGRCFVRWELAKRGIHVVHGLAPNGKYLLISEDGERCDLPRPNLQLLEDDATIADDGHTISVDSKRRPEA